MGISFTMMEEYTLESCMAELVWNRVSAAECQLNNDGFYQEAFDKGEELYKQLEAVVGPENIRLLNEYSDNWNTQATARAKSAYLTGLADGFAITQRLLCRAGY
ncbi:hypothetical protein ACP3TJ_10335 [Desulforudis sp. 1088]|uniref:hypothetical protein n=1 Tax=unclassified Candidatus Desulforudis TaxID=2635950 RepID=UPI003CE4EB65